MDILYTIAENYDGEELRYSLRSLKNIPHDRVFFVGGCPKWVKGVEHIPTTQSGTKYKNTTNNLKVACNDTRLSDDFIYFNDDFFILQPIKNPARDLNIYNGTVQSVLDALYEQHSIATPYMVGMEQTRDLLRFLGKSEPLSYELHAPIVFNKFNYLKMFEIEGVDKINCLHKRTLYGNLYYVGGKSQKDVKIFAGHKFNPDTLGTFLSCANNGFEKVRPYLQSKFPDKSPYEI